MLKTNKEVLLKGETLSEGIAIGKLHIIDCGEKESIKECSIKFSDIEKEIFRYRKAILSSREDLYKLQNFLAKIA